MFGILHPMGSDANAVRLACVWLRCPLRAALIALQFGLAVAACTRAPEGTSPAPSEPAASPAASASPQQSMPPGGADSVAEVGADPAAGAGVRAGPESETSAATSPAEAARAAVLAATTDPEALRRFVAPGKLRVCKRYVDEENPYRPAKCVTYGQDQLGDAQSLAAIRDVMGSPEWFELACRLERTRQVVCVANDHGRPGRRRWTFAVEHGRLRLVEATDEWTGIH